MTVTQPEVVLSQPWLRTRRARAVVASAAATLLALLAGAGLIAAAGGKPIAAYRAMIDGSFGSALDFGQVLVVIVPLLTIGLGLAIAFRGRVWNIGAEGQLFIGALAGGAVAVLVPLHVRGLLVPLTLVAGAAGGAFWGWIVGELRGRWGVNEVISSLLLNYIAIFLFDYVIRKPLRDPTASFLAGKPVPTDAALPVLPKLAVHAGIFVAVALVPVVWYVMAKTPFGFRVRMMGLNPEAARIAGVNSRRMIVRLMVISGAFAGLAGVIQVTGVSLRIDPSISNGYGFTAIVVALLGRMHPVGVVAAALFMAVLANGGQAISVVQGLPYSVVFAIQGIFVLFVVVIDRIAHAS
jgi:simple sugar transport system permease protein